MSLGEDKKSNDSLQQILRNGGRVEVIGEGYDRLQLSELTDGGLTGWVISRESNEKYECESAHRTQNNMNGICPCETTPEMTA